MSSLDVYGVVDPTVASSPEGGVELVLPGQGDYSGPGGRWVEGEPTVRTLPTVVVQQASMRTAEFLQEHGGTVLPSDLRVVYLNDGTMLYPDGDGKFSQLLRFSDGQAVRDWRVREADNRPWHNYCKAVVERYRGEA